LRKIQFKIVGLLALVMLFSACNSVKRLTDNQHLLIKNNITINDKRLPLPFTTIPLRLYIYNTARPNIDSILDAKYYSQPDKMDRKSKFLSRKQLDKLIKSKANFNSWIKRTGEAPAIVDTALTNKSITRLENYYKVNGWFNAKADYKINRFDNKKATIDYSITTGKPYILDSVNTKISSPVVKFIYDTYKDKTHIKSGKQYKLSTVFTEEDRIVDLMRNNGVYHFNKDYVRFVGDSIFGNNKINLETIVEDRLIREEDSTWREPFKAYKIKDVNVFTNSSFKNKDMTITDTTVYDGYTIYSIGDLKYRPKAIVNSIFIEPNALFKDKNRPLTSRKISDLRTFKYPNIDYVENSDTTLTANIYLTPLKKFELGFGAEALTSNIQRVGFSLNPSLLIRNVFNSAETLEISGFASIGASEDPNDDDPFFDINEFGGNLKLNIPRLFSPFNTEGIIPKSMFPSTTITIKRLLIR